MLGEEEEIVEDPILYIIASTCLVCFAGLCSGLNLGLLSMDDMKLKIIIETGTAKEARHAKRVLVVIKDHHLLLVTLLLMNALAMEALPICLDKVVGEVAAVLISVSAVLMFGEVIPQAACSRYGLEIGSFCAPIVNFLMTVSYPISKPIAICLDKLLGHEEHYFQRRELAELIKFHGDGSFQQAPQADDLPGVLREHKAAKDNRRGRDALTYDEIMIIRGAMAMSGKNVKHAMTPLEEVFMLSLDWNLDRETLKNIASFGHSRVPVYLHER
ncbi:hypothetical protein KIPB_002268 [Kipferlia bialata]|uniref:CNNM transmembrane domain-containing protein n=1 Tax=Kipferlia bialata TaxID=797122 RepID=A0A9K3GGI7_9EUKA|nr:hypothetical protein KIPB_002268 [Kipferlia bialata]|eukprot:g2268.t1